MFANLVRLALAAELAAWLVLAAWLHDRHAWAVAALVALVAGGSAAIRLVLVGATFCLSWLARSPRGPEARLGPAAAIAMVVAEWRAMLLNNYLWLPLERVALRPDPPLAPDERVPVILVHGYFSNRGTISGMARALDAAGVGPVFVPSLPAVVAPIDAFTAHLERVVREVTEATRQPRAILVCHSMGGLIARRLLATAGTARVAGLVTLGSPHHGSVLAQLGAGENGRQMRPGSDFLRELARAEGEKGPGCEALSIYTAHDNLVAPQDSSRLAWARTRAFHGMGHLTMLLDRNVQGAVIEELARLGARPSR